ncbi:MAG: carboxylesterase family protein [Lachnospiraceae bacterium]|nr:carboxylesterase family protein [Lachnospiraceae bacterium]
MNRTAKTENGMVKGLQGTDARITVYKGIPFAAPPVGKNRWRAPQPAENWEGIRECYSFGPISVQDTPGMGDDLYCREWHVDCDIPMDEDCLYLNVWTPAKSADEKLPVLFWIFGGGFQWGYTAEMEFDAERLASRGIVVVSVNYRLGALGFLSHEEITKEAPDAPGNFGFLDQKAGLHWVHRNIAAFGGDPDRIVIAGQSAGGCSVINQLTCKDNFDIIKGAVVISGMIRFDEEHAADDLFKPPTLPEAEKRGADFFSFLGVGSLEEARQLDAITIRDKYAKYREDHPFFAGMIDGHFCTGDAYQQFIDGDCAPVPVISGNTVDEFIVNGFNVVENSVKGIFAETLTKRPDAKLYYYRFSPDIPSRNGDNPGCFHSCDLWFFFETLIRCNRAYQGHHFDLARKMCNYLTAFVKTGDPNCTDNDGSAQPLWKPYTLDERNEMNFESAGPVAGMEVNRPRQAYNPYLPSCEYVPDGEPHVFGDRVYVFGSHDAYNGKTFCPNDYVCYSAPVEDKAAWRYEGVIYRKTDDPANAGGHMVLYAPDVTQGPDGRYYLYYALDKVTHISVAVCDSPAGKYEYLGEVHFPDGSVLGNREGDEPQFDPGVLTEGDKTYMFTGFSGHKDPSRKGAMLTVLGPDMLTIEKGPEYVVPSDLNSEGTGYEGHAFFEASSIRKRDGIYYYIYSSEVMHELCYATSDKIEGPYTYGGVIISNCDIGIGDYKDAKMSMAYGANNHGSIEKIGNEWYIFYHRHTNGTWTSRQGCAEKIAFTEDGKIPQVRLSSCGLNGGPLSDIGEYPAYLACHLFNEKHEMYVGDDGAPRVMQDGADGDFVTGYVGYIKKGVTMGFRSFDCKGVKGLKIWTKGFFGGDFVVKDSWDGKELGRIKVEGTNVWTAGETPLDFADGVHDLYLTFEGDGCGYMRGFEFLH